MAKKNGNILIVDDNRGVLTALQLLLKPYFEGIITLPSPVTLPSVLREKSWQVVLLDMNFTSGINTGNEGLYWLHEIKKLCPTLPVVLFTAYADIDLAVRGIKEGATDFVVKPWNNQKLVETLLNAVSASETKSPANGPNAGRTAESSHLFAHDTSRDTFVARAARRHHPPCRAFHRPLLQAIRQVPRPPDGRCLRETYAPPLVRQYPRTGTCHRKSHYHL